MDKFKDLIQFGQLESNASDDFDIICFQIFQNFFLNFSYLFLFLSIWHLVSPMKSLIHFRAIWTWTFFYSLKLQPLFHILDNICFFKWWIFVFHFGVL